MSSKGVVKLSCITSVWSNVVCCCDCWRRCSGVEEGEGGGNDDEGRGESLRRLKNCVPRQIIVSQWGRGGASIHAQPALAVVSER